MTLTDLMERTQTSPETATIAQETTEAAQETAAELTQEIDISARAMVLKLTQHRIGTRRKVSSSAVEVKRQAADDRRTDPDALTVSKEIIDCPELDAIETLDNKMRAWVAKRSSPAPLFRSSCYLIGMENVIEVSERLETYERRDRPALVNKLAEIFETRKAEAAGRLGSMYDPTDYPSVENVRRAFYTETAWIEFGTPRALQGLNAEVWRREQEKARAQLAAALAAGTEQLASELAEFTDRLVERLTGDDPKKPGRPKVFRDSLIGNVEEWLSLLESRNLAGDPRLTAIAERTRTVIRGVDADTLRSSPTTRDKVRESFEQLRAELDTMVQVAPSRRYADD